LKVRSSSKASPPFILLTAALLFVIILACGCLGTQRETDLPQANNFSSDPDEDYPLASLVADDLEIPWSLDFLPDGSIIFTERPGRVRLIDAEGGLLPEPVATIGEVAHTGEGGLLGITVHPDFEDNHFIYVYYTYREDSRLYNNVVRYTEENRQLADAQVIIDGIPGGGNHNGGRISFGPDGLLYITTGDAGESFLSQDLGSLAGKILRVTDEGNIPEDNPFQDSPVYTLGHRNPQGLAWDEQGRLWATEHGPAARDELNLIEAGNNYGWPEITGDDTASDMESPVIHSGMRTWAPSGAAYLNGSVFFAGLRGQSLYEVSIDPDDGLDSVELQEHFNGEFGRLRDVVAGPDGNLYVLTSNQDGRGRPVSGDDRMIRVNASML
jgi:glucose/arabinose dehydrogenase